MSKTENKRFPTGIKVKGIELLNSSINLPNLPEIALSSFRFIVSVESKVDVTAQLVFVIVHIEIHTEEESYILGSLTLSCIYSIANFDDTIKMNKGKYEIPQPLMELLSSTSLSTARGVMYSHFKGTFLHNALLPMIVSHQVNGR